MDFQSIIKTAKLSSKVSLVRLDVFLIFKTNFFLYFERKEKYTRKNF